MSSDFTPATPVAPAAPIQLVVVGLGPAGLERLPGAATAMVTDPDRAIVIRTLHHPAAVELAAIRPVVACDDLYDSGADFDEVYALITERVLDHLASGPVAYAVPGSAVVGERAVKMLLDAARRARDNRRGHSRGVVPRSGVGTHRL